MFVHFQEAEKCTMNLALLSQQYKYLSNERKKAVHEKWMKIYHICGRVRVHMAQRAILIQHVTSQLFM